MLMPTEVGYKSCAKMAYKDGLEVYKLVKPFLPFNAEYKREVVCGTDEISTTPVLFLLNGIAEGTGAGTRIGRQVRFNSLQINFTFKMKAAQTQSQIRLALVCDTQPNGANFTSAIYHEGGFNLCSMANPDVQGRFKTMKYFNVNLSDNGSQVQTRKYRVKIPRYIGQTEYNASGATITAIQKNAFFLIDVSDETSNLTDMAFECRMNYIDN